MESDGGSAGLGFAVVVLVIAGLAGWYFYSSPSTVQVTPVESQTTQVNTTTDTDTNIANDLNQIPDDSAMDQDAASLGTDIQSLK